MAESNLLVATRNTRRFLLYFVIFILVVIVLQVVVGLLSRNTPKSSTAATPTAANLNKFGSLATSGLRSQSIELAGNSKPIFNIKDKFTALGFNTINVHKLKSYTQEIKQQTIIKDVASKLLFKSEPTLLSNQASWSEGNRNLKFSYDLGTWEYSNSRAQPQNRFGTFLENKEAYRLLVDKLLSNLNLNRSTINLENLQVDYLSRRGNSFVAAANFQQAEFVKLRLYPLVNANTTPALNLKFVDLDYHSAPIEIIITANDPTKLEIADILSLKFIDLNTANDNAPYQLQTSENVWKQIESSQGKNGSIEQIVAENQDAYQFGQVSGQDLLSFQVDAPKVELIYTLEKIVNDYYLIPSYSYSGTARLANSPDRDNASFVMYAYAFSNPGQK